MSDQGLVLFTKPARPGRVKTRMIGRYSAAQAAALHAAFLDDVVAALRLGARDGGFDLRIAWALDDADAVPNEPTGDRLTHERQQGADLGARLYHGLRAAAALHTRVAAVGSDHPELQATTVRDAFDRLSSVAAADVVLGPAADGGYYLIALRATALDASLFEGVPWSTAAVFEATVARARRLGLTVALLPEAHDVDDAAALDALVDRLRLPGSAASPSTRALLVEWGLLAPEHRREIDGSHGETS